MLHGSSKVITCNYCACIGLGDEAMYIRSVLSIGTAYIYIVHVCTCMCVYCVCVCLCVVAGSPEERE